MHRYGHLDALQRREEENLRAAVRGIASDSGGILDAQYHGELGRYAFREARHAEAFCRGIHLPVRCERRGKLVIVRLRRAA